LARTDEIRLLDDQLVWKPPRTADAPPAVVGWHADKAYWGTCASDRLLTAWIPFSDVDEASGTLTVLDGSHRWSGTRHSRYFNDADLDRVAASFAESGREVRPVAFTLRRGQVSFHHGWTVHASGENHSDHPRLALAVHLQDRDNEYIPCHREDGTPVHMADEALCRRRADGTPDFADPFAFPRIWPVC
jgi:ectoine hydroxylase-related dioxygenase (phytanoyl-CoA dioxygenase family)